MRRYSSAPTTSRRRGGWCSRRSTCGGRNADARLPATPQEARGRAKPMRCWHGTGGAGARSRTVRTTEDHARAPCAWSDIGRENFAARDEELEMQTDQARGGQRPSLPAVAVVMGVSGSGKSTVAALLAARLHWEFKDGDWFHPAANI